MEKEYAYNIPKQPMKGMHAQYPMGPCPCNSPYCGMQQPYGLEQYPQMPEQDMPTPYGYQMPPYEMGEYPQQMMPQTDDFPGRPPYGQCPMCGCMIPPMQQGPMPYEMGKYPQQTPWVKPGPTPFTPRRRF